MWHIIIVVRQTLWLAVWPEKNRQMYIKVAQKLFHSINERFWQLYKNCLRMWEICAKSNKSPNLVTLVVSRQIDREARVWTQRHISGPSYKLSSIIDIMLALNTSYITSHCNSWKSQKLILKPSQKASKQNHSNEYIEHDLALKDIPGTIWFIHHLRMYQSIKYVPSTEGFTYIKGWL